MEVPDEAVVGSTIPLNFTITAGDPDTMKVDLFLSSLSTGQVYTVAEDVLVAPTVWVTIPGSTDTEPAPACGIPFNKSFSKFTYKHNSPVKINSSQPAACMYYYISAAICGESECMSADGYFVCCDSSSNAAKKYAESNIIIVYPRA